MTIESLDLISYIIRDSTCCVFFPYYIFGFGRLIVFVGARATSLAKNTPTNDFWAYARQLRKGRITCGACEISQSFP